MATDKPRKPDGSAQRGAPSSKSGGAEKGQQSKKGQQDQAKASTPRQQPRSSQGVRRSGAPRPASTSAPRSGAGGTSGKQGSSGTKSAKPAAGGTSPQRGTPATGGRGDSQQSPSRAHTPKQLGAGAGGTGAAGQGPSSDSSRRGAQGDQRSDQGQNPSQDRSGADGASQDAGRAPNEASNTGSSGDKGSQGQDPSSSGAGGTSGKAAGAAGAEGASGAADAAGKAQKAGQAADTAGKVEKASKGMDGVAGQVAGGAAQKAVEGDGSSGARRNAGRYAGAGVSGAVAGAQAGSAAGGVGAVPGAAIGAAKGLGVEAGKDAVKGASKVTGGSPVAEPADKRRLGAGGTGYERDSKKEEDSPGKKAAKVAAVGGAAVATPPALAMLALMQLLLWLKTLFFAAAAAAANAGNWLLAMAITAVQAVGKFLATPFVALGSMVSKGASAVFGVTAAAVAPVTAVASAVAVTVSGGVFTWGLLASVLDGGPVGGAIHNNSMACTVSGIGGGGETGPISANEEENAKAIYSVLKTWGMPEENIAGILGNWTAESGAMDPTAVEGIFDEPYRIGPRKKAAWDGNFTHIPGQDHGGIGLGQWSNDRTIMLLDYAESKGLDWYTVEAQLSFMIEKDTNKAIVQNMIEDSLGSPGEAAMYFHEKWEISADGAEGLANRRNQADMWFARMSGWQVDDSIAGEIKDIIGGAVDIVGGGVGTILGICEPGSGGGGGGSGAWDDRDGKTAPGSWGGYDNGKIPMSEMDELSWASGEYMRPDAAKDFEELNKAFKEEFGYDIGVTDTYRSYEEQVRIKEQKGWLAATPGYSNHGWGMAADLGTGINSFGTPEYNWMKEHAQEYGWKHPDWAEPGGSKPEAWHWEYWGYEK